MGKKSAPKRGLSKLEMQVKELQEDGWAFFTHSKKRKGITFLIGYKASKGRVEVTNTSLQLVIDEVINLDYEKLLRDHNAIHINIEKEISQNTF